MSMTREQFDVLVREVERGIGQHPDELRRHVVRLAVVGYAGLLGGLLLVVALAAVFLVPASMMHWSDAIILYIAGIVIGLGGSAAVLKVLWVKLKPPKGRAVTRAEAPALFVALDELQRQLRSAPFHQVLVVPECNAAVVQHPRLGVFGWPKNFLLLGLPLLDGLSADEMRAVLAHEFAHLSRQHGRIGQRVYCLRRSWEKVFEQLSKPRGQGEVSLRPLYAKFLDWFWPRFNAHAFVLSRADEYEADGDAARLTGAQHIASALLWIKLGARQFEDHFWPDLWQRANAEPEPPRDAFVKLRETFRAGFPPGEVGRWIQEAFHQKTTNADTHPCLTERLQAVGRLPDGVAQDQFPAVPAAPAVSASEPWFGENIFKIRVELGAVWAEEITEQWKERHARAGALQHRLARLDQSVPAPDTDVDALWDKARVVLDLKREKDAEPLLRQILSLNPKHCAANFHLGRVLLDESNPAGEAHLEAVMTEDDEAVPAASQILHAHYWRTGQTERIKELEARLDRYEKNLQASRTERNTVGANDPLLPHGLTPEELDGLRKILEAEQDLMVVNLGRKELKHFPKQKLFLLCVHRRRAWHRLPNRDMEQALIRCLSAKVQLPGRVLVFAPRGDFRKLAHRLAALPDAAVFRRRP
jgi:Zn-dependent protease with chaperone function